MAVSTEMDAVAVRKPPHWTREPARDLAPAPLGLGRRRDPDGGPGGGHDGCGVAAGSGERREGRAGLAPTAAAPGAHQRRRATPVGAGRVDRAAAGAAPALPADDVLGGDR